MLPYNNNMGQRIRTDVPGVSADMGFISHFQIPEDLAVAASNTGVHAAMNLGAAAQELSTGITSPVVPRNLAVNGNAAGITGNVVITGTNMADAAIEESIALNGTNVVEGNKAFKSVSQIDLPVRTHTPTKQVETFAVTHGADAAGTVEVIVTAAGMGNNPKSVYVDVTAGDNEAAEVSAKIRTALGVDTDVSMLFDISGEGANIILTSKTEAADDNTLSITAHGNTGVTVGSSTNAVAGVAGVQQVETIAVTAGCSQDGVIVVTVTAADLDGGTKDVDVEVLASDNTAALVATKVRAALTADADIAALFTVGGADANVILTAKTAAADDATLQIAMIDAPATNAALGPSANTTAGVAPVQQVETVAVTNPSSGVGTLVVTVTGAGLDGGSKQVNTAVTGDDNTAALVAAKVRDAISADQDVAALFTVSGADADVILTAKTAAADDATLEITLTNADSTGVTFGASANTTAGVAGVAQVETVIATSGATAAGVLKVTVTAAGMNNSPKAVSAWLDATDSTTALVAEAVRAALSADADVSAFFTISGEGANIVLTAKIAAANDGTMAVTNSDAPATNVTFGASGNTTAGFAPVKQAESVQVTHEAEREGKLFVTLTAVGMNNSPVTVEVDVTAEDDAEDIAVKVAAELGANADIAAFFDISVLTDTVTVTAKTAAANDASMAFSLITDTAVTISASADTTAGVAPDTVSIGWGDKLGLPYKLTHNTVLFACLDNVRESTDPAVTVDSVNIEGNTADLDSALNGKAVDIYLLV